VAIILDHSQMVDDNRGKVFLPGSIHRDDVRQFWSEVLRASPWVMDVLANGYKLPFTKMPGQYQERNNASVLKNLDVAVSMVQELKELKRLLFV